jgi:uncharacterized integral membrane protein
MFSATEQKHATSRQVALQEQPLTAVQTIFLESTHAATILTTIHLRLTSLHRLSQFVTNKPEVAQQER